MLKSQIQRGLSLIELLVGMTVGIVVVGGAFVAFINMSRNASEVLAASKVDTEITALVNLIGNEIRRAGYFETTALQASFNEPSKYLKNLENRSDCIIYAYQEPNEAITKWYGYKFNDNSDSIEALVGQTTAISSCDEGVWNAINNSSSLQITSFVVNFCNNGVASGLSCTDNGTIQIQVSARNSSQSASYNASRTIATRVYLRN